MRDVTLHLYPSSLKINVSLDVTKPCLLPCFCAVLQQVIGGTATGQVLIWDFRAPSAPLARSSLASGPTLPVVALQLIPHAAGEAAAVTVTSDGRVCTWALRDLLEPLTLTRIDAPHNANPGNAIAGALTAGQGVLSAAGISAGDLCVTAAAFPSRDSAHAVLAGTEEGLMTLCKLKADAPGACAAWGSTAARGAPVTAVAFQVRVCRRTEK